MQYHWRFCRMDILFTYLKVFLIGGGICVIGQVLINLTKITSSRI
ncbi:MAG: SpoVA/SpoVAEb family sporulation membrane protein, partial [Clostridia bacterium]|nr:SpoVA/SpoVAEb family sporulation membrane protein [Clostridia bacterium]